MRQQARLQGPGSTASEQVQLSLTSDELLVRTSAGVRSYRRDEIKSSAPQAGIPLWVSLPDGAVLELAAGELAGALAARRGKALDWLEKNLILILPVMVLMLGALYLLLQRVVLPAFSEWGSRQVPAELIAAWSDEFWLGEQSDNMFTVLAEAEHKNQRTRLTKLGAQMAAQVDDEFRYQFILIDGKRYGINALALPGGRILVTDRLMDAMSDQEVAAVLGHEIGHVRLRHSVQSLFRTLPWTAVGLLSGNLGLIRGTAMLSELSYSRQHESEADCFGATVLARAGLNPLLMATSLEKAYHPPDDKALGSGLKSSAEDETEEFDLPSFLLTHPKLEDREDNLRDCPI